MRDILFRGIKKLAGREKGDGWIYGNLMVSKEGHAFIGNVGTDDPITGITSLWWEVDPDTVGQYTGLRDRIARQIFEDDIVLTLYGEAEKTGLIVWDEEVPGFKVVQNEWMDLLDCHCAGYLEIIGNRVDNPDFLPEFMKKERRIGTEDVEK